MFAEELPEPEPEMEPLEDKKSKKKSKKEKKESVPPVMVQPMNDPDDDLLGDLFGTSVSINPAPAPAQASAGPVDDLMDLLGDMTPQPTRQQAPMPTMSSGGGLLKPSSGMSSAKPELPVAIQGELGGAMNDWSMGKVAGDDTLDVHTAKVHKADELCLLVIVENKTITPLSGIEIALDPPRNLRAAYIGEPQPMVQGNRLVVPNLAGRSKAFVVVKLGFIDVAPSMALRGQVGCQGKSLSFQTLIEITDLLRPLPLSTQEFAARWQTAGDGKRVWISPTSVRSPEEFSSRIQNKMCINPVETIGNEVISAGQVMGSGGSVVVLIHAAVDMAKSGVNITVNSPKTTLSDLVCRSCQAVFK